MLTQLGAATPRRLWQLALAVIVVLYGIVGFADPASADSPGGDDGDDGHRYFEMATTDVCSQTGGRA